MTHRYSMASIKFALLGIILGTTMAANASLLDCTSNLGVELLSGGGCAPIESMINQTPDYVVTDSIPAAPINAELVTFHVDQAHRANTMPNSIPLLVLISALLAILLVRAKGFNTK